MSLDRSKELTTHTRSMLWLKGSMLITTDREQCSSHMHDFQGVTPSYTHTHTYWSISEQHSATCDSVLINSCLIINIHSCCIIQHFEFPLCSIKHATNPTSDCTHKHCTVHHIQHSVSHPFRWCPVLINHFPRWEQMAPFGSRTRSEERKTSQLMRPLHMCVCTEASC